MKEWMMYKLNNLFLYTIINKYDFCKIYIEIYSSFDIPNKLLDFLFIYIIIYIFPVLHFIHIYNVFWS